MLGRIGSAFSPVGAEAIYDVRYLQILNNLSDLNNVATARTNLGLVAGGSGDIWVEKAGDTMTGNLVFSDAQKIIGGSATTADLTFQTTSGVGATGADMHFLVGNNGATEAMTILNSGNVGIGTTAPSTLLDVQTASGIYQVSRFGGLQAANTTGKYISFMGGTAGATIKGVLGFAHTGSGTDTIFTGELADGMGLQATGAFQLGTNGNNIRMTVDTSGNVGIGTTVPQSLLDVQGPVGTGAVGAGILTLATKELTIVDGDQLGRINFNAPLATPGSDAILAGAAIWAEADITFSATENNTELVFGTATTSAAVERMRLDSSGNLTFSQATTISTTTGDLTINASGQTIFLDDGVVNLGTSQDIAMVLSSAGVAANTALTDVLLLTTAGSRQAVAANSLLVSNITANGDMGFYVNKGGTSYEWLLADASAGIVYAGMSVAGSTNLVQIGNRDATNAASHARILLKVTHASADPFLTFSAGSDISIGMDNSATGDNFEIVDGSTMGTNVLFRVNRVTTVLTTGGKVMTNVGGTGMSLSNGADRSWDGLQITAHTNTLLGTTTVTTLNAMLRVGVLTIIQSGGAVTMDAAAGTSSISPTAGASVTLTHSSAFRALTGGAAVNVSGLYAEAQTGGTTGNYQILMANGGGVRPALADHAGLVALDFAAGDTRLYVVPEAGSSFDLGNDRFNYAAATGYVSIAGTDVLTLTATSVAMGNDVLIRRDVNAGITASTTQTQGNGALTAEVNEVSVVANVNDTVTLPTAAAGLRIVIINNGANTLRIFPASADNLGAGVDTATTLAAGSNVVYQAFDATNWESI